MAVIVTLIDNSGTAVSSTTFGDADSYSIESGILTVTQEGNLRASFREWRAVVVAKPDEVDQVIEAMAPPTGEH